MTEIYSETQLDTLREVANIGAGTASTALAQLLHRPVDISVPHARVLPLADGLAELGTVTGVVVSVTGDVPAVVLVALTPGDVVRICALLGVDPDGELASSALSEVGYIVACHYLGSLERLTGLMLEPAPPQLLGEAPDLGDAEVALFIDTELRVEGEACGMTFLFTPGADATAQLLTALGVA
jgi:chemotaxis protein CheC